MTYIVAKLAVSDTAVERPLITIEFAPKIHPDETEYSYKHPQFVFGDCVILKNEYPQREYNVVGMELIESKTSSGRLLSQPRWKYKVSNSEVCYWKEESAIKASKSPSVNQTCADCSYFQDYQEPKFFEIDGNLVVNKNRGKGWCNCFNHQTRTHHQMVGDCILNGSLDTSEDANSTEVVELDRDGYPIEANSFNSSFHVGSIVKIIDPEEHHTEWAVFEVVECKYNQYIHDPHKPEAYQNHVDWYYRLASNNDGCTLGKLLWVTENEICHFDQSHQICTPDIF